MRMLIVAAAMTVAGIQTEATAGALISSSRAHKYLAGTVTAIAAVCLSCSQPQAPKGIDIPAANVSHGNTRTMTSTMTSPIELISYQQPTIELIAHTLDSEIANISSIIYVGTALDTDPHTITIDREVPIILTFDDGPDTRKLSANGTNQVLNTLDNLDINAVFFIQTHARSKSGKYYRAMHEGIGTPLVKRMHDEQHIIASHTGMDAWGAHAMANNHVRREAAGKLGDDLQRSKTFIYELTGEEPKFVRPPFGIQNRAVRQRYAEHDLKMILWDIDSRDTRRTYDRPDIEKHLKHSTESFARAGKGLVILFHDIDPDTYQLDNLIAYIKVIEQSIKDKNLVANFKMSRQEIEEILLD